MARLIIKAAIACVAVATVAINGWFALGGRNSETDPAAVSAYSTPDAVGGVLGNAPAALFPTPYAESWVAAAAWCDTLCGGSASNDAVKSLSRLESDPHDPIHELGWTVPPTPTQAPPTPTVQVRAASVYTPIPHSGGVEQWRELVASIFPAWAVDAALSVIRCESGGNPNATGAAGERGLFQIHPLHFDSTHDPEGNVRAAYRISGGGAGWGAWTCRP